jgi:tRNA threonylcarbamoyladenosine biosynthesis protein TsaE
LKQFLENEQATRVFGQRIAQRIKPGAVVYLYGDLGAGKTTLVRSILQSIVPNLRVKSPTYAIVEPYEINQTRYYHLDLYRIGSKQELYDLGLEDVFEVGTVCFIEWPERGAGVLPPATMTIHLTSQDAGRLCEVVDA